MSESKYAVVVEQTRKWTTEIDAGSLEEARAKAEALQVDDLGEPGGVERRHIVNRAERKGPPYTDDELRYAATSRCNCGAGMAYYREVRLSDMADCAWECSDILTRRAVPASQPGSKEHTPPLPFAFYEIKSEDQPSARGQTTRPKPAEAP